MKVRIENTFGRKEVVLFATETPNEQAKFAMMLLERWGAVNCIEDGEDAAGRQKMRLLSPAETANRAFDIAEQAFDIARERGLMLALPDLNEINQEYDAKKLLDND